MFPKLLFFIAILFITGHVAAQNSALQFLGTNEHVQIPPSSAYNFGSNDFTVEARVNFDDLNRNGGIVQAWTGGLCSNVGWGLIPEPNGRIYFYIGDGSSTCGLDSAVSSGLNTQQCYHVAGVKNGSTLSIYINGVLDGTGTTSRVLTDSIPVRIGKRYANSNSGTHDGTIEEVRMWNVARTPAQIQSNMNTSLSGSPIGLVGYWPLDDGAGLIVADQSSAGNNGTMVNMNATSSWVPTLCPDTSVVSVPTISQWGLILLGLLVLCLGAIAIWNERKALAS